jgi:hypothetical protein
MRFGIGILFLIGVLIVGAIGYQIGVSQAITVAAPGATTVPAVYPYFWHPFGWFGFGFLGLLFPLLFLFLIFGALRAAFGGGRWGGYRHGWYGGDRRAMLEQWHREMHGEKPAAGTEQQREEGPRR